VTPARVPVNVIDPFSAAFDLETDGLYVGTNLDTGAEVYLSPKTLENVHVQLIGPPGCGKTRLMSFMAATLMHDPNAVVICIDPKPGSPFFTECRNFALSEGLAPKVDLLDLSDLRLGFDCMAGDGLPPAMLAQAIREAFAAALSQDDMSQTRQLRRFLFYFIYAGLLATEGFSEGQGLGFVANLMLPGSRERKALIPKLPDARLKATLSYIDALPLARQDTLLASTHAVIDAFAGNPYIAHMFGKRPRLSVARVMTEKRRLFINLGAKNPLDWDNVRVLGKMVMNLIFLHAFMRPNLDTPVWVFCDEASLCVSEDVAKCMDLGRQLNVKLVLAHQRLEQLRVESENLLDAVVSHTKVKFIFGACSTRDLRILEEEVRLHERDPWKIKHVLTSQEISYTEEERFVYTYTESSSDGVGLARPRTESYGTSEEESEGWSESETFSEEESISESATFGSSWAITEGEEESVSETHTHGWSRSVTDAEQEAIAFSESESEAESESFSASAAHGAGRAHSRTSTNGTHVGWGTSEGQSWDGYATNPGEMHYSEGTSVSGARSHATSLGESENAFDLASESYADALSRSHSRGTTVSHGTSHAVTEGESESIARGTTHGRSTSTQEGGSVSQSQGETYGHGRAVQSGYQHGRSSGTSHSISEGVVPSRSHEEGRSHSVSITPFLEPHARRVISSIEYLSQDEQQLLAMQDMQGKRPQQCTAVINDHIVNTQAPYHPATEIAQITLLTQLARANDRPEECETPLRLARECAETAAVPLLAAPMKDVTPQQPLIPEVLPPAHADDPDDVYKPTNEDFLEPCHGYNEETLAMAPQRDHGSLNLRAGTHRMTPRGERILALLDERHGYRLMRSTHLMEFLKYYFSEDLSEQTSTRYLRWLADEKEILRITRDPDSHKVAKGSLPKIYGLYNEANLALNERKDKPSFVIPHALEVTSTMAGVARACRESQGAMRIIDAPDLLRSWGTAQAKAAAKPYTWKVQVVYRGETHTCSITPDRLFAIYFTALEHRWGLVLEEDRTTEPQQRDDYNFNAGTSLFRKFLTYCFAYHMRVPLRLYNMKGFRILFVTDSQTRIKHAVEIWQLANDVLKAFQKQSGIEIRAVPNNVLNCVVRPTLRASDMFTVPWTNGRDEEVFITPPVAAPLLSSVG
jgi:hypothetical protein